MNKLLLILPLLFVFSCGPPVYAQQSCAPRDYVVELLQDRYSEYRLLLASTKDNYLLEFFGSETTGTWTIFLTSDDGISCIVSSGTGFILDQQEEKGEPT